MLLPWGTLLLISTEIALTITGIREDGDVHQAVKAVFLTVSFVTVTRIARMVKMKARSVAVMGNKIETAPIPSQERQRDGVVRLAVNSVFLTVRSVTASRIAIVVKMKARSVVVMGNKIEPAPIP